MILPKKCGVLLLGVVLLASACQQKSTTNTEKAPEPKENWVSLFNGKDLTGWDIKISGHEVNDNFNNTFLVEDGIIKANYSEYDSFRMEFGHLYYEKPYSHYRLRMEYRFLGEQVPGGPVWANTNSGVMLHCLSAQEQQLNQNFPISIEMQFLGAVEGEERTNGNLASPGTHVIVGDSLHTNHMLYSDYTAPAGEDWVSVEAVVLGDSIIHHIVEGDTVLTYTNPRVGGWELEEETGWVDDKTWVTDNEGIPLKEGYIALQAEGHTVHFRNVEILDLVDQYKN